MAVIGLRNTTDINAPGSHARPENWRSMMLRLYPYGKQQAPLAALTAAMKSESTNDPKYHWFRKVTNTHRFTLAQNLTGGDASGTQQNITLDAATSAFGLKSGDVLMVEQTGEQLMVYQTPVDAATISVLRGWEGAASQAVTFAGAGINPNIMKIGSAYEEGSAAPDPIGWDPDEYDNQTQIFREAYGMTGTAQKTFTRTGEVIRENKMDCLEAFQQSMERTFIFGKKRTTTRNNQPLRMTDGILNMLTSDRKISATTYDANGLITPTYWASLTATLFRYGSPEKWAWCGLTALLAVTEAVRLNSTLQWELGPVQKEYGMDIQRLRTPAGTLVLKVHPMFGQITSGTTGGTFYPGLDNAMLILDMANLKYRYMEGRDVTYQTNMQLPGVDGMLAGYMAECGLELHHPETHLYITGIRGGKKE